MTMTLKSTKHGRRDEARKLEVAERYARQVILPEVGREGQSILGQSVVAIVGMGALGSVTSELLCRAGVGKLLLIDPDRVELSNLQRQALYTEEDIGVPKALAAQQHLREINSEIAVTAIVKAIGSTTIAMLDEADLILDCTDNLATRLLLNEYAMREKLPFIYCGAVGTRAMIYIVDPSRQERACFNCIFEKLRATEHCGAAGVLNTTTHIAAAIQTGEALKILLKKEYTEELLLLNAWEMAVEKYAVRKNPGCPVCQGRYERLSGKEPLVEYCAARGCFKVELNRKLDLERVKAHARVLEEGEEGARLLIEGEEVFLWKHGALEVKTKERAVVERVLERISCG